MQISKPATAVTQLSLLKLIEARQAELGLTDKELCDALGFERDIVFTLIKQGTMKLPINKLPALANALLLDAATLLRTALPELSPGLLAMIEGVNNPLSLSTPEVNLIQHLRKLSGDRVGVPIVFEGNAIIALVTA